MYSDVIKLQSFGHEHIDTFRLSGKNSVLFSVPSLSTGYPRTNPTIRLWHTNYTNVNDWTQYHMDLINSNLERKYRTISFILFYFPNSICCVIHYKA